MKSARLVAFDLDNTVYDWYAAFIPAFYAMVESAVEILACDREQLLDEFKAVHVVRHNVEHPFSLLETPTYKRFAADLGSDAARTKIDPAFYAFNKVRKANLTLFPTVGNVFSELRAAGVTLVAFTDSSYHAVLWRLEKLEISQFFAHVYCRARPADGSQSEMATPTVNVIELPAHEAKPDPRIIWDIAERESVALDEMIYVGDSLAKDILMAKRAGCASVWARYGSSVAAENYSRLIRISHWDSSAIERELATRKEADQVKPDFVCNTALDELLGFEPVTAALAA